MVDPIKVLIQTAAGSCERRLYNEKTLEYKETRRLSCPFPYAYGFILDTTADDGGNLDCYLITREKLAPGTIVTCEPVGLLEQYEDDEVDHKILAALPGEQVALDQALHQELQDFIARLFSGDPGMRVSVGPLLPRQAAEQHIRASRF